MKPCTHMTFSELVRIETLLEEEYNKSAIAIRIERDKTSVYRCVRGNKNADGSCTVVQADNYVRICPVSVEQGQVKNMLLLKGRENMKPRRLP